LAEKLETIYAAKMQLKEITKALQLQHDALNTENHALIIQIA